MTPNEQALATQIELAQVFWLPCACTLDVQEQSARFHETFPPHEDCGGTGKRWPLQKPCPGEIIGDIGYCRLKWPDSFR